MIHLRIIKRIVRNILIVVAWYLLWVIILRQIPCDDGSMTIGAVFGLAIPASFCSAILGTIAVDIVRVEYRNAVRRERELEENKQRQIRDITEFGILPGDKS